MQWPNLNVAAQSFADLQVYKSTSVLDTFAIGDPEVLIRFLRTQYTAAAFVGKKVNGLTEPDNTEIELVFAKNITTYFNAVQQPLVPQMARGAQYFVRMCARILLIIKGGMAGSPGCIHKRKGGPDGTEPASTA